MVFGVTQLLNEMSTTIARHPDLMDPVRVKGAALEVNILVAAAFIGLGILARKRQGWAYLTGLILYVLDGVVCLLATNPAGVIFHAFFLFFIVRGYLALLDLHRRGDGTEPVSLDASPATPDSGDEGLS